MSRTFLAALAVVIAGVVAGVSSADGSLVQSPEGVVVARDGELFAVALATGAEVRLTTTRAWESAPAVSPDGQTIAYGRSPDRSKDPTLWTMGLTEPPVAAAVEAGLRRGRPTARRSTSRAGIAVRSARTSGGRAPRVADRYPSRG